MIIVNVRNERNSFLFKDYMIEISYALIRDILRSMSGT